MHSVLLNKAKQVYFAVNWKECAKKSSVIGPDENYDYKDLSNCPT